MASALVFLWRLGINIALHHLHTWLCCPLRIKSRYCPYLRILTAEYPVNGLTIILSYEQNRE